MTDEATQPVKLFTSQHHRDLVVEGLITEFGWTREQAEAYADEHFEIYPVIR